MKRILIFIAGAILLSIATAAVAAEQTTPFNPMIHNGENLPEGILYMHSGNIDFIDEEGFVVVDDTQYPLSARARVFNWAGLTVPREDLKQGQKVDVYANDKHEAVYIVIK